MNYIHNLQLQLTAETARREALEESLQQFRVFLHSSKFTGFESDGSRKDWIATGDVVHWIRDSVTSAITASEAAAATAKTRIATGVAKAALAWPEQLAA